MRRLLVIAIACAAAMYLAVPPRARTLPSRPSELVEPVSGAFHVHTERSDGSGTVEQVARAASRAGLQFVILTDHGDATREPDPPAYHDGVLMIDAVEISTENGHVVALRLPKSPYPLGGEARDVVEDIHRMRGVAIAAHPASRKSELRWSDWSVPIEGLEFLNGDSEWRDEPAWRLGRALLAYPIRPAQTLGLLFDRSDEAMRHWDAQSKERHVVAIAGADAHGRMGIRAQEPYKGRLALPLPGYESVFRAMSIALPRIRLSNDALVDMGVVIDEIVAGRVFSSVDALGQRPAFAFMATSGIVRATGGEVLKADGPVRIEAIVQGPAEARVALYRDGAQIVESNGPALRQDVEPRPATYRVEVRLPDAPGQPPVPWIVSNPIHVNRQPRESKPIDRPAAVAKHDLYVDGPAPDWIVEHSSESRAAVDVVKAVFGTQVLFRYALAGPASSHPFAALAVPSGPALTGHDRLTFAVRADRPMRLSVQLRAPTSPEGERWHRSVFVDTIRREVSIWFDEMKPRGITSTPKPPLDRIGTILFVVDTISTPVGTAGQLVLDDVRYER